MSWDASPTWSGYIFQGEVALCKAIETINAAVNILDEYCLKIEEEEDFSLHEADTQIFQVKAYTAHNYTKYKKAWKDMMERYPNNSSNNYLILHKGNIEYDKFGEIVQKDKLINNIIAGTYMLDNICNKLDEQIRILLSANQIDFIDDDITTKRNYCCAKIYNSIKVRHQTKQVESISLNVLKRWILEEASLTINEEIAWYEVIKIFFNNLRIGIEYYDINMPDQKKIVENLNKAIFLLEELSISEIRKLLSEYLVPHKKINNKDIRKSMISFIDDATVRNVVQTAIKRIEQDPIYKTLQYVRSEGGEHTVYQLTIHNNEFDLDDQSERVLFQQHCEFINNQPISEDVDYFVTKSLEIEKDNVKKHLINVTYAPADYDPDNDPSTQLCNNKNFGFKTINTAINDLNENE